MAAAPFRECRPAGGCENIASAGSGGSGLTGSITSASPTSNTLSVPPLSRPWRLHQSSGKTDRRFLVSVIVVAFMGGRLCCRAESVNTRHEADFHSRWRETMTAGRVFLPSEPGGGSKLANRIAPRFTAWLPPATSAPSHRRCWRRGPSRRARIAGYPPSLDAGATSRARVLPTHLRSLAPDARV